MSSLKIKTFFCCSLFLLFFWTFLVLPAEATSLFQPSNSMGNLFSDYKARQVGDTVTIIISEVSSSNQKASTSSNKSSNLNAGEAKIGADSNNAINSFFSKILPISNKTDGKFSGDGSTTRTGSLHAQMTAVVTEILPNGNLVIEGSQKINVNSENQEISVKGTVRPGDIGPQNEVLSTSIANAEIKYKGKGTLGDVQKPGILTRFFHWLF